MEREMERDESQKEIAALKEQLKEKDKDKETCELVTKEASNVRFFSFFSLAAAVAVWME